MKNLLYLLPLLAAGCGSILESAPVVVEPKAPAFTVPEGSAAVEVSTHAACDCDLSRAEVAAEIQAVKNDVAGVKAQLAAHIRDNPKSAEPKLTKPADNAGPPKPPAAPLIRPAGEGILSGGGCANGQCGPASRVFSGRIFGRRR